MRQNADLLAKIGADTAENDQHFAEISPKFATTLWVHHGLGDAGLAFRPGQRQEVRPGALDVEDEADGREAPSLDLGSLFGQIATRR